MGSNPLPAPHWAVRLHAWYHPPSRRLWHCSDQYGSPIRRPSSQGVEQYLQRARRQAGMGRESSLPTANNPLALSQSIRRLPLVKGGTLFSSVLLLLFPKLSPLGWQFVIYWVLLEFKLWPGHREGCSPSQPSSFLFYSVGSAASTFYLISKLGRGHKASLRSLWRSLEGTARVQWLFFCHWQFLNPEYGNGCKWDFLTHLNGPQAKWLFLSP